MAQKREVGSHGNALGRGVGDDPGAQLFERAPRAGLDVDVDDVIHGNALAHRRRAGRRRGRRDGIGLQGLVRQTLRRLGVIGKEGLAARDGHHRGDALGARRSRDVAEEQRVAAHDHAQVGGQRQPGDRSPQHDAFDNRGRALPDKRVDDVVDERVACSRIEHEVDVDGQVTFLPDVGHGIEKLLHIDGHF